MDAAKIGEPAKPPTDGWIECGLDWEDQFPPGTWVELEEGAILLVGHVNELAGVCDDCTVFANPLIRAVVRYRLP